MTDPVTISVLTVVRNCRDTVLETMASVAAQTYEHVEHIVQDGLSTDGTQEQVLAAATPIVSFESRRDHGVYDGFNNAIGRSTGDVVGFLNGDDFFETNDVLARIAASFDDPAIAMVFGNVALVRPEDTSHVVRLYSSAGFRPSALARGIMPAHPSLYVRRSLFAQAGLFDPSFRIAGDFEWVARAFTKVNPGYRYLPQTIVRMRMGGLSTSGIRSTIRITREIRRACAANGIATSYPRLLSRFPAKLLEYLRRSPPVA